MLQQIYNYLTDKKFYSRYKYYSIYKCYIRYNYLIDVVMAINIITDINLTNTNIIADINTVTDILASIITDNKYTVDILCSGWLMEQTEIRLRLYGPCVNWTGYAGHDPVYVKCVPVFVSAAVRFTSIMCSLSFL